MLKRSIIPIAKQIECCVGAIENVVENVPDEGDFYFTHPGNVIEKRSWMIIKSATKMLVQLFKYDPKQSDDYDDSKQIVGAYILNAISQIILRLYVVEEATTTWVSGATNDASNKATEKVMNELSLMAEALVEAVRANVLGRKI